MCRPTCLLESSVVLKQTSCKCYTCLTAYASQMYGCRQLKIQSTIFEFLHGYAHFWQTRVPLTRRVEESAESVTFRKVLQAWMTLLIVTKISIHLRIFCMIRISSSTPHHTSSPPTQNKQASFYILTKLKKSQLKHDSRLTRNSQRIHTPAVLPSPCYGSGAQKKRAAYELPVFQHNSKCGREESARRH